MVSKGGWTKSLWIFLKNNNGLLWVKLLFCCILRPFSPLFAHMSRDILQDVHAAINEVQDNVASKFKDSSK